MMECTKEWESDGRKPLILRGKYGYQFLRLFPKDGFCCYFPCYGELKWKPMHSPCDEIYHRIGMEWQKSTHIMGKVCVPISQVFLIRCVLLHFTMPWNIDVKTCAFPIWWDSLIFSCDIHLLKFILEKSIVLHQCKGGLAEKG